MLRINEELTADKILSVRFCFKPVAIPSTEDLKFSEEESRFIYSSVVWLNDENTWGILEFDQSIFNVLNAYALRNSGMQKLECLLSRYADGTIRINAGSDTLIPVAELVEQQEFNVTKNRASRLLDRYRKLGNYQLML